MTLDELVLHSRLEPKHYEKAHVRIPVIESSLYTTLGRQLFEYYQKYKISTDDQRDLERLNFLLMSFVLSRSQQKVGLWNRVRSLWSGSRVI